MKTNIGAFIKELREEKSWSQQIFADMFPIDRSNISRWENNEVQPPYDKLIKICEIFDIELSELASGERKTKDNKQKQNKNLIDIFIKQDYKYKKVKLFCLSLAILLFIISFIFLIYYFNQTYNTEKIYKIYTDSEEYKIYDGLFVITSENSYMKIGSINNKVHDIELYLQKDNKNDLVYSGSSDAIINDYNGYKEYFDLKNINKYVDKIYLKIDGKEIKLNFVEMYNNDNLLIKKENNITNKEDKNKKNNINLNLSVFIKKNFICDEVECNFEKDNYTYNYNILSKKLSIIDKKKNEYVFYDIFNNTFTFSSDNCSYTYVDDKMSCLNVNCDNYKQSYEKYIKLINTVLN